MTLIENSDLPPDTDTRPDATPVGSPDTSPTKSPAPSLDQVAEHNEASPIPKSEEEWIFAKKEPFGPEPQEPGLNRTPDIDSSNRIENSPGAKSAAIIGNNNLQCEINNFFNKDGKSRPYRLFGEDRALFSITEPLIFEKASPLHLEEHYTYREKLWQSRLVLVSCADEEIGLQAGRELIDGLGFPDKHKRLLNLRREDEEINGLDVESLVKKTTKDEKGTGVLISAFRDPKRTFLDSLFSVADELTIAPLLKDKDVYLVCVADPGQVRGKADFHNQDCRFSHWEISFLRPLLQQSRLEDSDNLESLIQKQRERDCWSRDEVRFALEVRRAIKKGTLQDRVNSFETNSKMVSPVDELFNGDDPIQETVVFAATYFPNLTPVNFIRVVAALLEDRTVQANSSTIKRNDAGVIEVVETPKETPAADVWRDGADKIMARCQMEFVSGADSIKVVDFVDQGMRKSVESHLESHCSLYLERQAERIRLCGLIFDPSPAVGESAANFILSRALSSPDDFDKSWLVETVSRLERTVTSEPDEGEAGPALAPSPHDFNSDREVSVNYFFSRNTANEVPLGPTKARAYTRIAELLRAMLEDRTLGNKVAEVLEQLMSARLFTGVLEIAKRLRFAPSFDDLYWINQLFERGDKRCNQRAFKYLLTYLKGFQSDIYQKLADLRNWLPHAESDRANKAGISALNLVMKYCVDTTLDFSSEHYGSWPSRFPLFVVNDRKLFEQNATLLAEFLFFPAMKEVEKSELIGLVIAVWSFILRGPPGKAGRKAASRSGKGRARLSTQLGPGEDGALDGDAMLRSLLRQIASAATAEDRKTLPVEWQQIIDFVNVWIDDLPFNNPLRAELIWQRNQTRELIRQFRDAIKAIREESKQAGAAPRR